MPSRRAIEANGGREANVHGRKTWCLLAGVLALAVLTLAAAPNDLLVYFGTYTGAKSKGIYVARLNTATGALSAPQLAAETPNPSYLAVRAQGDFLYAVNEVDMFDAQPAGSVSAFKIDRATGLLTLLNQRSSIGAGPAYLGLDRTGRTVLVANYGGGSVTALPIAADGSLEQPTSFIQHTGSSVNRDRQREPHAHQIVVDPLNRFAYAADLGTDKIAIYRFDAAMHTLSVTSPGFASLEPGAGPRHLAISAQGGFVYVISELNCTITVFRRDAGNGALSAVQVVSSLPPGVPRQPGFSTAELALSPSGAFLYGSNRGHDSISVFAVDPASGRLRYVDNTPTGGKTPRGFGIEPGGAFLVAANQNSDSVVVFKIDRGTGRLTATGVRLDVGAPVDVKFVKP
jgi:6-phosphogluconolactonase